MRTASYFACFLALLFCKASILVAQHIANEQILQLLATSPRSSLPASPLALDPQNTEEAPYYYLAKAVAQLESNRPLAADFLKRAKEHAPSELGQLIHFYEAKIHWQTGAFRQAAAILQTLKASTRIVSSFDFEIHDLLLKSLYHAQSFAEFLNALETVKKASRYQSLLEEHYWHAALIYEKEKNYGKMFAYLEMLLSSYPITTSARQAFLKLIDYACDRKTALSRPVYYFSPAQLTKLARNASLDESLKAFLVAASNFPLRVKGEEQARLLSLEEKITYLFDVRLYKEAYQLAQESYDESPAKQEGEDRKSLLELMGKLANRLQRHQEAVRYFSLSRPKPAQQSQYLKRSEYLADSLSYGGFKDMASRIYGEVAAKSNNKLLSWHHFWNNYSANNWDKSSQLFAKSAVPPRDHLLPHGSLYWRARVYEHKAEHEKAVSIYQKLLSQTSDDAYGIFIALRQPQLVANKDSHLNPEGSEMLKLWHKAMLTDRHLPIPTQSPLLRILYRLYQAGLYEDALRYIPKVDLERQNREELAFLSHLAEKIGAFHIQQQAARKFIVKFLPTALDWQSTTSHQKKFAPIWQAHYPLAYNKLMVAVTKVLEVDPYFILSIMQAESEYQETAVSYVGARGLMQIMPYTAVQIAKRLGHLDFSLQKMWDPLTNIVYGSWYLKLLLSVYDHNPILAAAAYNAGPFAVQAWMERCGNCEFDEFIESIPYRETRQYVKNVMKTYVRYSWIHAGRHKLEHFSRIPAKITPLADLF